MRRRSLSYGAHAQRSVTALRRALRRFLGNDRGVAAVEFALIAGVVIYAFVNAVDIGLYLYKEMEVENATQVAAQAAWKACDLTHLPATTNCPGLQSAVNTAVQSTSLGASVTLQSGSPSEGYYCVNAASALQYISNVSSKPADCTAAGQPSIQPGDYIDIQTSYTYAPLFPALSIAGTFKTPITRSALMRLG
jgi:Flp pilus assembly protein TadG